MSFTELIGFVLRTDELLHDIEDGSLPVPRRGFRNRLNAMEVFNGREFLARYCFTKATVTSLPKLLSLEEYENSRCLQIPPVPQLLIALQFMALRHSVVRLPTVCRVVGQVWRLIASTFFRRLGKVPGSSADLNLVSETCINSAYALKILVRHCMSETCQRGEFAFMLLNTHSYCSISLRWTTWRRSDGRTKVP